MHISVWKCVIHNTVLLHTYIHTYYTHLHVSFECNEFRNPICIWWFSSYSLKIRNGGAGRCWCGCWGYNIRCRGVFGIKMNSSSSSPPLPLLLLPPLLLRFLLRKQGLRHTPQMHCSLEAYCAMLGPPTPDLDVPASTTRCPPTSTQHERPLAAKGGTLWARIFQ